MHDAAREGGATYQNEVDYYRAVRKAYMPVGREFGNLLYALVRSSKAKAVVEFGTSFGISAIYLAAAVRDNGEGKVITTEFEPEKAEQAKSNLEAAGLQEWVELRMGDALETLKADFPQEIDLILLDGAKGLYLSVLKLLEPRLRERASSPATTPIIKGWGGFSNISPRSRERIHVSSNHHGWNAKGTRDHPSPLSAPTRHGKP